MDFNFDAIIKMAILAEAHKKSPASAKLLNVFLKRGISIQDALAILLEMTTLAKQMTKEEETDND